MLNLKKKDVIVAEINFSEQKAEVFLQNDDNTEQFHSSGGNNQVINGTQENIMRHKPFEFLGNKRLN